MKEWTEMAAKKDPLHTLSEVARILSKDRAKALHAMTVYRWCVYGVRGVLLSHQVQGNNRMIRMSDVNEFFRKIAVAKEIHGKQLSKQRKGQNRKRKADAGTAT